MLATDTTSDYARSRSLPPPPQPNLKHILVGPWAPGTAAPSQIAPRLWQGPLVPRGNALRRMGFDVVVLMAQEHQPRSAELPGVLVVHCPIDDDPRGLSSRGYAAAEQCADRVAAEVRQGRNVLVTCAAGLNRSGLVMALALRNLYRIPGPAAVQHVQSRRAGALSNPAFREYVLRRLPRVR